MAKKATQLVRLNSTGTNAKGNPTGYDYIKERNPRKQPEKLRMRKFDPRAIHPETGKPGCHVWFEEKKMPRSKK